ncbi:MAG TPA: DNA mismatch repair protein MutS [Pyrinomonadaceae bacterium]|nr:DNA mismatch repair protein MutS [Pyrinomonadaceae bacterium]HMP64937.1 DNA mismatch repair protein MutS [Pyrinomonadaceae bacterium]
MGNVTPMLRQYLEIKSQYPGTILFFRLGDFYEMFNEDAVVGARELDITLTARQKDSPNPIPMCGVPHHAAATYISRLVRKGYRVAICEQAEPADKSTKLVRREVVRVISPGTAVDPQLNEPRDSNFLAAVFASEGSVGMALLDLSSGEFTATQFDGNDAWPQVADTLKAYPVREMLVPEDAEARYKKHLNLEGSGSSLFAKEHRSNQNDLVDSGFVITNTDSGSFEPERASELLRKHFKLHNLKGVGLEEKILAVSAAGACLLYARETQRSTADHVSAISYFERSDSLVLDAVTITNLEIFESRAGDAGRSLLGVIDTCVTSMGSRLLRSWLLRPSIKRSEVETRLAAVQELGDSMLRERVRHLLKNISDIERLVGRLNLASASPRDLIAIGRSLEQVPFLQAALNDADSLLLQVLSENIFDLPEIRELISNAITDEPPVNLSEGGIIRGGFNEELDELRHVAGSVKQTIAAFEEKERERTNIPTLKVRFNNVFGYYIEVSKANLAKVPDDYQRRQTLANAERYTTDQLKEWEQKVLGAEEMILQIEQEVFAQVKERVRSETRRLQTTARALATLDVLAGFSETAARSNFVRPVLHDGDEIEIKGGRHPVVEPFISSSFVPNDVYLNNSTDRLLIVTGANMGGKSTILRQVALIQLLAQIGSFVPAAAARLPIADRIFTRVGASDDLSSGRSTFMVEMTETAAILHSATPRSLVLLDEIGRGTSTFDGLSIAWAVAEYIHDSVEHSAKTMFATHYHELTELAELLPGAKNYQISATEKDGEVVFLHKLVKGKASKSYGIAVARLAGLPPKVIERAKDVLARLEKYELAVFSEGSEHGMAAVAGRSVAAQATLFSIGNDAVVDEIREADVSKLSPEECKDLLQHLKKKLM